MFIAHIRHSDHTEQLVQTHLEEVADLANQYGKPFDLAAHAELAGFLHDMGKFTVNFTKYLKNAVLEDKIATAKIDHSTAGAKYLYDNYYGKNNIYNYVIETVGMTILSHHSGLQNFIQLDLKVSDYLRRVKNSELPNYDEVVKNFESIDGNINRVEQLLDASADEFRRFMKKLKSSPQMDNPYIYLNLMQKLVFSCLIDADRTNTRCFEENDSTYQVKNNESVFKSAYHTLMTTMKLWNKSVTPINKLRNAMSESCDRFASKLSGIYTLTIPTGGGKTFSSLRYALKHAQTYRKSRIIYVVPYTTILEQNAEAVREIIQQPEVVLEHHANIIDDHNLDDEVDLYQINYHKKLQLGRDNWDYPIIFTTMVQFLDAFYQKGTRKSRRLHNLTNSVIIFDEVQSVPYQHTSLFNSAVNFLHFIGNSSILLCTATQPEVESSNPSIILSDEGEIVPNLNQIIKSFERVSFHNKVNSEGWDTADISHFTETLIENTNSILIILNTKAAVRKLYEQLAKQSIAEVIHLSTSMCPAHRKEKLAHMRNQLANKEKVICISTQLIEAGVDISFEAVIRSLAGLDSIAQAAGRCNRNSERKNGDVYIIRSKDEHLSKLPEIRIGGEITENYILSDPNLANDLLSPRAIQTYFKHFQAQANREILKTPKGFDHDLFKLLDGSLATKQPFQTNSIGMFKTLEGHFEAIDSPTTSVIAPYKKGNDIIASLNDNIQDYTHLMS